MSLLFTLPLEARQPEILLRSVIWPMSTRCDLPSGWPQEGSLWSVGGSRDLNISHLIGRTYFTPRTLAATESEKHSLGFVASAVQEPTPERSRTPLLSPIPLDSSALPAPFFLPSPRTLIFNDLFTEFNAGWLCLSLAV